MLTLEPAEDMCAKPRSDGIWARVNGGARQLEMRLSCSQPVGVSEHLGRKSVWGRSLWGLLIKRKQRTQAKHPLWGNTRFLEAMFSSARHVFLRPSLDLALEPCAIESVNQRDRADERG